MKTRLIFSTVALAIAGWCYATGYTLTLYADGCESANVIKCDVNQQVNITAVPKNARRHFVRWTDGNTDNPRTIVVTQDTTFTAEFAPNRYTITASGEHGTVEGTGTYDYDTRVSLKAVPDKHYHFVKWSDGNTDNPRTVSVEGDATYTAEFLLNEYTITVLYDNIKGYVSGGGTYDYGTTTTLTATANEHYHFTQWSDGNTDNPRTVAVEDNATYTAEFKSDSYTIIVSAGEHGSANGGGTYDYGTTATLTATADEHYHFTQWSDGNTDNPRTVSVVGDATYTAEFAIDQHTITTNAHNGTITGGGTYDYGTTATLTATANEHYHFTQWSDGNTDNPRTISVEGDATYTAEFKPDSYTIIVSAGEHGSANGGGTYDYGTTATLTATADEHYHFTQWSDGNTDNPRTVSVEGDATYTAEFLLNEYTITVLYDNIKGYVSGGGTYDYGTTATLTATANEHYHFTQWSDGNTDNPRTVSVVGDATYTAEFAIDQHTITTNAHNGTITGGGTYDYGTTATLTATANEHYHFTQWSDGNTDNPRTVSVVGDATYTAEFAINRHSITVIYDTQQGVVTGAGMYDYGTQVTLTAFASKGYEFAQWSNGVTDNPYLLTATADLTLEAQFVPTTAVENVSADGDTTVRKIFRNGQVFILRGSKTYTLTGEEVE